MKFEIVIDPETGSLKIEKSYDGVEKLTAAQVDWIIKRIEKDYLGELYKIERNKLTGRKMPSRNRDFNR